MPQTVLVGGVLDLAPLINRVFLDPEEDIYEGKVMDLRLSGRLSTMIQENLGRRLYVQPSEEICPLPVALHICSESRYHTRRHYHLVKFLAGSFYFNPRRDLFTFSVDYGLEDVYLEDVHIFTKNLLKTLSKVEMLLVPHD
jgi:hypothetical protein